MTMIRLYPAKKISWRNCCTPERSPGTIRRKTDKI